MKRIRIDTRLLMLSLIGSLLLTGCERGAERSTPPAPAAAPQQVPRSAKNEVLLSASSPFEDLTEYAETGDEEGMGRAIRSFEEQAEGARAVLTPASRARLDSLVTAIKRERLAGNRNAVALDAVEAYHVLVASLDSTALTVPRAVSMLDYAGFKLDVQAGATPPDWQAMQATATEARGFWNAIRPSLHDGALRDAVKTAIDGMDQAVGAQDARMARLAARVDLALVDLLEQYYEGAGGPAPSSAGAASEEKD